MKINEIFISRGHNVLLILQKLLRRTHIIQEHLAKPTRTFFCHFLTFYLKDFSLLILLKLSSTKPNIFEFKKEVLSVPSKTVLSIGAVKFFEIYRLKNLVTFWISRLVTAENFYCKPGLFFPVTAGMIIT